MNIEYLRGLKSFYKEARDSATKRYLLLLRSRRSFHRNMDLGDCFLGNSQR